MTPSLVTQGIKYFGCKPKVHGRSKSELGSKPIVDQKTSENLTKSKSVVSKCKKDSPKKAAPKASEDNLATTSVMNGKKD